MEVAAPIVSIVDGPLQGDWAYQPISANGIKRETVKIVDKGRLTAGLGDVFSARQAGVAISGAARVEGFDQIPLPRMTNIRIETDKTIPLDKPWHQVSPRELYQLLLKQKLIERDEEVYYLLGYKGGQVNTQHGDFVFNCSAVYRLADQPELFQPGIFAGKTLSALQAIKASIGPLLTDAMGTCGKWGQGVPSSGGSAAFLVLDSSPEITLGGE
jgi:TldD protein